MDSCLHRRANRQCSIPINDQYRICSDNIDTTPLRSKSPIIARSHLISSPEQQVEVPQGLKPSSLLAWAARLVVPFPIGLGGTTERRALPGPIYEMASVMSERASEI